MKAQLYGENFEDANFERLNPLLCDDIYNYLIYYNTTSGKYNIITDCYINNNDSFILANNTLYIGNKDKTNYIRC